MKTESKLWRPSRWTPNKRKRTILHAKKHCYEALKVIIGWYDAGLRMAEINRDMQERQSVKMLNEQGISTMGEFTAYNKARAAKEQP